MNDPSASCAAPSSPTSPSSTAFESLSRSSSLPLQQQQQQEKGSQNHELSMKKPQRVPSFHDPQNYLLGFQVTKPKSRLRSRLSEEFESLQSVLPF